MHFPLSPTQLLPDLHEEATIYLTRLLQWLTLELRYIETLEDTQLSQANDMIPEINARDVFLDRRVRSLKFVYNLQ